MNALEQSVFRLVNDARQEHFLPSLTCEPRLVEAARSWSRQMCQTRKLSHDRMTFRFRSTRVDFRSVGENVAAGQASAAAVMRSWLQSPGHRANILKRNFQTIGIGYVPCDDPLAHYWTQMFLERP